MTRIATALAALALLFATLPTSTALAAEKPDTGEAAEGAAADCERVTVGKLIEDRASGTPVVQLLTKGGERAVPIYIGEAEAAAIFRYQHEIEAPRPLTHDLVAAVVEKFGGKITRVTVTSLRNETFYAEIEVTTKTGKLSIDARPSDSIALAIKTGCPVYVARPVLEKAARPAGKLEPDGDGVPGVVDPKDAI